MKKAVVIGAGISGIATSIRLACQGYEVLIIEANSYPGGKLSTFSLGHYRFDAGPSLFTMPHFVDELFELAGENPKDFFDYKKKAVACHYFWNDGTRYKAYGDRNKLLSEAHQVFGVQPDKLKKYLKKAAKKYERTKRLFLEKSLHDWRTFLSKDTIIGLAKLHTFDLFKTLNQANTKDLEEPHLVQLYNRYATYNGSDPYQTSGMMTLIQHLEQEYGTFVPKQGMYAITESLLSLAKRKGVQVRLNTKVDEIVVEKNVVKGVMVNNTHTEADVVISNMDIVPTYRKLLPRNSAPEKTLKQERSSSAIIFYWGIKASFPMLDLHNIFFAEDYKAEFNAIFKSKTLTNDPTIYVNITSKDVENDAPMGCENWFVMINAPHDTGQDWTALSTKLRQHVLAKLNKILGTDLEPLIEEETVMTPSDIAIRTGSYKGALYGASSNHQRSAFLRHPNFSQQISNLYFCGGSVHPGGGIPLCLLSAKIVADSIQRKSL